MRALLLTLLLAATASAQTPKMTPIDRHALVTRHNPRVTNFEPFAAQSVGNGEFAFTADATGLQTFPQLYQKEFPLGTTAQWAWHNAPLPPNVKREEFRYENWDTYGRAVPYPTNSAGQEALYNWLRANPHRFHLGRIGFEISRADGTPAQPQDIGNSEQTLDLWRGELTSKFTFENETVRVQTVCHPTQDLLAVRVESPLLRTGKIKIKIAFPYGSPAQSMADWNAINKHQTQVKKYSKRRYIFAHDGRCEVFCRVPFFARRRAARSRAAHLYFAKRNGYFGIIDSLRAR